MRGTVWAKTNEQLEQEALEQERLQNIRKQKGNAVQARAWLNDIFESGQSLKVLNRIFKTNGHSLSNLASGKTKRLADRLFVPISGYHDSWRREHLVPVVRPKECPKAIQQKPKQNIPVPDPSVRLDHTAIDRKIYRVEHRIALLKTLLELGEQL